MTLFDFPNPTAISETRFETSTPLQRLFFLNSAFLTRLSEALVARLDSGGGDPAPARIRQIYRILFGRNPTTEELRLGRRFLRKNEKSWPEYARVLLSSNEFLYVK